MDTKEEAFAVMKIEQCNKDYEMETIMAIKEEISVSDFGSENEKQLFPKSPVMDAKQYVIGCEVKIKTELKDEIVLDRGLENDTQFFSEENPVMKVKHCNKDFELDTKIEINEEQWWLETTSMEASSVYSETKDGMNESFFSTASKRLLAGVMPKDKSVLFLDEDSGKDINLNVSEDSPEHETARKYNSYESDLPEISSVEKDVPTKPHAGGDMSEYKCTVCDKRFTSPSHLKTHKMYDCKRTHKCTVCDKSFTLLTNLKRHKLLHEGIKLHKCEICEKSLTRLSDLKRHILLHENSQPHHCDICGKRLSRLSYLQRHKQFHCGKMPYRCDICGSGFIGLPDLEKHKLVQKCKELQKCYICGKAFICLYDLKRHKLAHRDKKPHKCDACDKDFFRLTDLKTHKLTHEGQKPHKCEICEKSFTWLSALKRHTFVHKDQKPYKCNICEKSFIRFSCLEKHKLVHNGKKSHKRDKLIHKAKKKT